MGDRTLDTWGMKTRGGRRREARRDKRRGRREERRDDRAEARELRKHGPDQAYYGGSEEAQKGAREEAKSDTSQGRENAVQSRRLFKSEVDRISGNTESVINRRAAELAGKPTIGTATENAIRANQQNSRQQLAAQVGMMNRQARGLAGSMGEGGALAMQQAMASGGANAADLAAQNQLQNNQQMAGMRFNAAAQQRAEDVAGANMGADARLGALQQQLAGRDSMMGADQNAFQNAQANQMGLEGTILGLEQQKNQAAYEAAQQRGFTGFMKRVSNAFTNTKAAIDSSDMGPAGKLFGKQQPV